MLKSNEKAPEVPQEAFDMCIGGQEVTIVDPTLRASMKQAEQSHGIHKVEWKCLDFSSGDDSGYEGLDSEGVVDTSESDDNDEIVITNTPGRRVRAAPFYKEVLPG